MKIHINNTNTGDLKTMLSHFCTTGSKAIAMRLLKGCQSRIKGQPVKLATELLTIALFTKVTIPAQLKEINPAGNN